MDSCLDCEKDFQKRQWYYVFYDESFCTNCTTEEDKKLLESNADNCFMTYSE